MIRNPISDSRRQYVYKFVYNKLVDSSIENFDPKNPYLDNSIPSELKVIKKTSVGPYKLVMWENTKYSHEHAGFSGRYLFSGLRNVIINGDPAQEVVEVAWNKFLELANKMSVGRSEEAASVINSIAEADPTISGEYSLWIAKQVFLGNLNIGINNTEDVEKVQEDLSSFEKLKQRNIIPKEFRDINKFATYSDFFKVLKAHGGVKSDRESLQIALKRATSVYKSPKWEVILIKSWQAAKKLASGTSWCVRGTDAAQTYLREPEKYPLYLFLRNGERYALLTNLPGSQQLMDVNNSQVKQTEIEEDQELLKLVIDYSDWIYCENCRKFYWGETEESSSSELLRNLSLERDFSNIASYIGDSAIFAEIPPQFIGEDIVGDPKLFESKIVCGSALEVLKIPDAKLPDVNVFAEMAGFSAVQYVKSLLKTETCDICHGITSKEEALTNAQHALYVLKFCEDFPACGHELLSTGASGCPPMTVDGQQVGMRCICGTFIPSDHGSSICRPCLMRPDPSDPYDYDNNFEEDEDYDEDEDEDYEGCPFQDALDKLSEMVKKYEQFATQNWTGRDHQHQPYYGPNWDNFCKLEKMLTNYRKFFYAQSRKYLASRKGQIFKDLREQGWFSREILVKYLLPTMKELLAIMKADNASTAEDICCAKPDEHSS